MKLTLLLDLDDTLLVNNLELFLHAYLKLLSQHLQPLTQTNQLVHHLLEATRAMTEKNLPAQTLEEVFDQGFYPAIGTPKSELEGEIVNFYKNVYPQLHEITRPQQGGVELVRAVSQNGASVVIATNPLFPELALLERLKWAGFSEENRPFSLVTHYRTFHFSKPNPAYYAEILAQLGWPNQPAVMVGNSLTDDIIPASALGMPCYWVTELDEPLPPDLHPLSSSGPLTGVLPWLEKVAQVGQPLEFKTITSFLAVLRSTPAALDTLTSQLSEEEWLYRPQPGEWSATEICAHLRDADREVNLPRMRKLIREDQTYITAIDTDSWASERNYQAQDGPAALHTFTQARTELLTLLDRLEPEDWERTAVHTIFGPTRLRELVEFMATHDRTHIQQIAATIDQSKKTF